MRKVTVGEAKKLLDKVNTLDAQYLLDFPRKMSASTYNKRRKALEKKFVSMKKRLRGMT